MKIILNTLLTTVLLFGLSNAVFSQNFQGKAEYFTKVTFDKKTEENSSTKPTPVDKDFDEAIEAAMKKASETKYVLNFSKQEANYDKIIELEKPEAASSGMSISISFDSGESGIQYIDLKNKIKRTEANIMDKPFIIEEPLTAYDWQILDDTKQIGDYQCQKAKLMVPVSENENAEYQEFLKKEETKPSLFKMKAPQPKTVIAWFTTQIPVNLGPKNYWGLPGLILELIENDTESTTMCYKITLNSKEKFIIKAPTKGKVVSQKEFDKLQKDKFDSMKNDDGVIIFNRN